MDYSLSIWSIATYIEANIKHEIEYDKLEQISGFTYRHIRTIMKSVTGISLSQYILSRRIANAAFELVHTRKSITDIAFDYNFNSYDAFARSFKRVSGKSPKAFREGQYAVGHRRILMGFYAPEIYKNTDISYSHPTLKEEEMEKKVEKYTSSCILFGVPKVAYSYEECTPLAVSIKSALNYLGDPVDYTYLLSAMGAAFRLRWNMNYWDGGNVDVVNIYEKQYDVLSHAFEACNRKYKLLPRSKASKEDFKNFIVKEINEGRPVIALGIIGPPEAGLVTGYEEDGNILYGWNCFQEHKEMATGVTYHECGYYKTDGWWDNPETLALISIGDKKEGSVTDKAILKNALEILTKEEIPVQNELGTVRAKYAGGQLAYDYWAKDILKEADFSPDAIMPIKFEKLMCQGDAQATIGEGRAYAACYMEHLGKKYKDLSPLFSQAAKHFNATAQSIHKMYELRGGFQQTAQVLENFMKRDVREKTAELVYEAKAHELKAVKVLEKILNKM